MTLPLDWSYPWVQEVPPDWPTGYLGPNQVLVQALQRVHFPKQSLALELGAGRNGLYLALEGFTTFLVDCDVEVLDWFEGFLSTQNCTFTTLHIDAREFHFSQPFQIISSGIAVYLKRSEMENLIKRAQDCLASGGLLHLEFKTPNDHSFHWVQTYSMPEIEPGTFDRTQHPCPCGCGFTTISFWSPEEVKALFEDNRHFKIVYFDLHEWIETNYGSPDGLSYGQFWSICQITLRKRGTSFSTAPPI